MTDTPLRAQTFDHLDQTFEFLGVRLEVGSSIAISRARARRALAISTIWRWATRRVRIGAVTSMAGSSSASRRRALGLLPCAVDEQARPPAQRGTQEDVLRHRQFGNLLQFLVDHGDPGLGRVAGDRIVR